MEEKKNEYYFEGTWYYYTFANSLEEAEKNFKEIAIEDFGFDDEYTVEEIKGEE